MLSLFNFMDSFVPTPFDFASSVALASLRVKRICYAGNIYYPSSWTTFPIDLTVNPIFLYAEITEPQLNSNLIRMRGQEVTILSHSTYYYMYLSWKDGTTVTAKICCGSSGANSYSTLINFFAFY